MCFSFTPHFSSASIVSVSTFLAWWLSSFFLPERVHQRGCPASSGAVHVCISIHTGICCHRMQIPETVICLCWELAMKSLNEEGPCVTTDQQHGHPLTPVGLKYFKECSFLPGNKQTSHLPRAVVMDEVRDLCWAEKGRARYWECPSSLGFGKVEGNWTFNRKSYRDL